MIRYGQGDYVRHTDRIGLGGWFLVVCFVLAVLLILFE